MIAFKNFSDGNFKRVTSFMLATVVCVLLTLPAKAEAGWIEDQITYIKNTINSVYNFALVARNTALNIKTTIQNATGTITDGKIQNLIADMKTMLQTAVEAQQAGVVAFMDGGDCIINDGTPCGNFRADLIAVVHLSRTLSNQILTLHNIPGLNLEIQDLGLADMIGKLPGRVLLPLYRVVTKTQLLTPELIDALQNMGGNLENLKTVLFIEDFPSLPTPLERCQFVDTHSTAFKISANTIKGIGIIVKVLGKLFEALGKTPAGGPNEIDAGIHGYVHATVKTNTLGTIGKILGAISTPLSSLSSFVSNKVSSCGDMVRDAEVKARQILMLTNQSTILQAINSIDPNTDLTEVKDNQTTIMNDQQSTLTGQQEILCALQSNRPAHCAPFVGNGFDKGKP